MKTPSPNTTNSVGKLPRIPKAPKLKVEITKELFESSKQADSSHCMIAAAIQIAFPEATSVSVDLQTIRLSRPKKKLRYIYLTPRTAQKAIIEFDQGREVEPFSFQLSGAHVTAMHQSKSQKLQGIEIDQDTAAPKKVEIELKKNTENIKKANLAKQGLRFDKGDNGTVPRRVGGKAPPTTPFGRRRAFGLRALER